MEDYATKTMKKNHEMAKEQMRIANDPEYYALWAKNMRIQYDALIKEGFSPSAAIAIITETIQGQTSSTSDEGGEE